ncbi:hypothetical protein QL285_017761 [Trifolium repens]|nr:hypothetical protein QL285_017761 [Trifolium repens]
MVEEYVEDQLQISLCSSPTEVKVEKRRTINRHPAYEQKAIVFDKLRGSKCTRGNEVESDEKEKVEKAIVFVTEDAADKNVAFHLPKESMFGEPNGDECVIC